jgi:leucyl-tRNA synthetase
MMIFTNEATKWERRPRAVIEPFVLLLSPFAPHLAEDLWERLGHHETLAYEPWPAFDPELLRGDTVTVAVQVNGKLRATLELPRGVDQATAQSAALGDERVKRHVDGGSWKVSLLQALNLVVG